MTKPQKKTIRIRKGRQADAVALFRLLQEAYGNAKAPHPALDEDRLMLWIVKGLAHDETWVADLSGRVVGSICLVPVQPDWSLEWVLSNRWLYVLEKFRREGTGRMLIEAVIRSADEKGAPLWLGTHGGDADWKDEFLGKFEGMAYGGGMFMRPPRGGDDGSR